MIFYYCVLGIAVIFLLYYNYVNSFHRVERYYFKNNRKYYYLLKVALFIIVVSIIMSVRVFLYEYMQKIIKK